METEVIILIIIIAIIVFGLIQLYLYFYIKEKIVDNTRLSKIIKTLVRQASRWTTASAQDENVMIAVLHANYGAGYLWALKDIATDEEIREITKIDVLKFRDEITRNQDIMTKKMAKLCPQWAPPPTFLAELGNEN